MQRTLAPAIALLLTLAACGDGDTDNEAAAPSVPTAATESAAAEVDPVDDYDTTWDLPEPDLTQSILNRYSSEQATDAVDVALEAIQRVGFDSDLVTADLEDLTIDDLAVFDDLMTEDSRSDWNNSARALLTTTDTAAIDSIYALATIALADVFEFPPRFGYSTEGPAFIDPAITKAVASMASNGSVEVATRSTAVLRQTTGPKATPTKFDRRVSLFVILTSDGWKVDGWRGNVRSSPVDKR